jgi:hypothetical protein
MTSEAKIKLDSGFRRNDERSEDQAEFRLSPE